MKHQTSVHIGYLPSDTTQEVWKSWQAARRRQQTPVGSTAKFPDPTDPDDDNSDGHEQITLRSFCAKFNGKLNRDQSFEILLNAAEQSIEDDRKDVPLSDALMIEQMHDRQEQVHQSLDSLVNVSGMMTELSRCWTKSPKRRVR